MNWLRLMSIGFLILTLLLVANACGGGGAAPTPIPTPTPTSTPITAPEVEWSKTFGGPEDDSASSIQQTSDGGYIIAGDTESYGAGWHDFWLVKTDEVCEEQWSKTFGGSRDERTTSLQQTSDGGYIIAGWTWSYGAGGDDFWIVKTDEVGEEQWSKTLGGRYSDGSESIQQTSDGGYIIAGGTRSYGSGGTDIWIVKTDEVGEEQWSKTFGGPEDEWALSIQQTSDGGYIIACGTGSYGTGVFDNWIVKTDEGGEEQWSKTFGGTENDYADCVQQTSDGGYIIAGGTESYGAEGFDLWLVKTDEGGEQQWSKIFGWHGSEIAFSVQQTSDGGYIIAGWTTSYGAGKWDFWVVKMDEGGEEQWSNTFGGPDNDVPSSIQQTSDGGYIIAGYTESYGAGGQDLWLVKLK